MEEQKLPENSKPKRKRILAVAPSPAKRARAPRAPLPDKEIRQALKRLNYAVDSSNIEMFKIAAYQIVQQKLVEVATLLRMVAPNRTGDPVMPAPAIATAPAARPLTLENIERQVQQMDSAAAAPQPAAVKNPCQWCGRPGIRKNTRGMWVCRGHLALAVEDDQVARLRQRLQQGFGNDEEMIQVDTGTIARAMQNAQSGE